MTRKLTIPTLRILKERVNYLLSLSEKLTADGTEINVTDNEFTINDATDATKQITFDAAGTTGTKTTITGSQTANRVITLPNTTDTLVCRDDIATLNNKVIGDTNNIIAQDDAFKIADATDETKFIDFDSAGTTATTTTIRAAQTGNVVVTLPDATTTIPGKSVNETITGQYKFTNGLTQFGSTAPGDTWSTGNALEISATSSIFGQSAELDIGENAYYNAGWKYQNTDSASLIALAGGTVNLFVAGSDTADTAIAWTTALKCESDGTVKGLGGNWLISPNGVDLTPSWQQVLYESTGSSDIYTQYCNVTTGTSAADGFLVGLNSSETAVLNNKENSDMLFYTNAVGRGKISNSGNWLISQDGTNITPNNDLVIYKGSSGQSTLQLCNSTTGNTSVDGFIVQLGSDEAIYLWNYENTDFKFATNNLQEMYLDASNRGLVVGSPTGDGKGVGTINAEAVYDDNVLLTCYVFDAAIDGDINELKWHEKVPNRIDKETKEVTERNHEPMLKFKSKLNSNENPLDIDNYANHWKTKRHLTSMPNESNYDPNNKLDMGNWVQRLIETVEIQAVLIEQLNQRLKAIEV